MTTKDTNPYADSPLEPQGSTVVHTAITEEPLEPLLAEAKRQTMTQQMGALVIFDGIVRNHDHGQAVAALSYSSHPQAQDFMERTVQGVADQLAGVRLWAVHRVGSIAIGESALTVLATAAHRGLAFTACEMVADHIKAEVPIWKEQELTDGAVEWVGIDTPPATR